MHLDAIEIKVLKVFFDAQCDEYGELIEEASQVVRSKQLEKALVPLSHREIRPYMIRFRDAQVIEQQDEGAGWVLTRLGISCVKELFVKKDII